MFRIRLCEPPDPARVMPPTKSSPARDTAGGAQRPVAQGHQGALGSSSANAAHMTKISRAMMTHAAIGKKGIHRKLANMLQVATATVAPRAHIARFRRNHPAAAAATPSRRCAQPHPVTVSLPRK